MPTSLLTAPLGVRAAHAMSKRTLEIAFGCYLFIVGSRFVISLKAVGWILVVIGCFDGLRALRAPFGDRVIRILFTNSKH